MARYNLSLSETGLKPHCWGSHYSVTQWDVAHASSGGAAQTDNEENILLRQVELFSISIYSSMTWGMFSSARGDGEGAVRAILNNVSSPSCGGYQLSITKMAARHRRIC